MEAVIDIGSAAPVVRPRVAKRLGVWKRAKLTLRQGDETRMKGSKFVVNTSFSFLHTDVQGKSGVPGKFLFPCRDL